MTWSKSHETILWSAALGGALALCLAAGCGDDVTSASTSSSNATNSGSSGSGTAQGSGGSSSSSAAGGSSSASGGSTGGDIPGGGTVLFQESFDDNNFMARGWYDGAAGDITTTDAVMGGAFDCHFATSATSCSGGKPARHKFSDSETVYLSFHLKFGSNWVGSGKPYHPHMLHFLTNADPDYIGPSSTHLTTYTEVIQGGRAMLALQDSLNVDGGCILLNNDSFVGCNGDFNSYAFDENRSVCSCNGLVGDLDGRDCFDSGNGWYSSRSWRSPGAAFSDNQWHFVEVYFAMNTVAGGIGQADGKIRWVQDGQTLVSSDAILMRTGANANLAFNQFAMLPYIGDGSPIDQHFYIDELTVATARP